MRIIDNHLQTIDQESCVALTVHDEIVAIAPEAKAQEVFEFMGNVMATPPAWCANSGLVLASEGGIDDCYSK